MRDISGPKNSISSSRSYSSSSTTSSAKTTYISNIGGSVIEKIVPLAAAQHPRHKNPCDTWWEYRGKGEKYNVYAA